MLARDIVQYQLLPLVDLDTLADLATAGSLDGRRELIRRIGGMTTDQLAKHFLAYNRPPFRQLLRERLTDLSRWDLIRFLSVRNEPRLLLVPLNHLEARELLHQAVRDESLVLSSFLAAHLGLDELARAPVGRGEVLLATPSLIPQLEGDVTLIGDFFRISMVEGGVAQLRMLVSKLQEIPLDSLTYLEALLGREESIIWRQALDGETVPSRSYGGLLRELLDLLEWIMWEGPPIVG